MYVCCLLSYVFMYVLCLYYIYKQNYTLHPRYDWDFDFPCLLVHVLLYIGYNLSRYGSLVISSTMYVFRALSVYTFLEHMYVIRVLVYFSVIPSILLAPCMWFARVVACTFVIYMYLETVIIFYNNSCHLCCCVYPNWVLVLLSSLWYRDLVMINIIIIVIIILKRYYYYYS